MKKTFQKKAMALGMAAVMSVTSGVIVDTTSIQAAVKNLKKANVTSSMVLGVKCKNKIAVKKVPAKTVIKYTSKNKKVATVDKKGNVTGKKNGKTTITVKLTYKKKTVTKKCKVTVKAAVKSVKVAKKTVNLEVGKTYKTKVTIKPAKANKAVAFKSSNKAVASVTAKGVVKGLKAGKAKITVTAADGSKKKATFTVNVAAAAPVATASTGAVTASAVATTPAATATVAPTATAPVATATAPVATATTAPTTTPTTAPTVTPTAIVTATATVAPTTTPTTTPTTAPTVTPTAVAPATEVTTKFAKNTATAVVKVVTESGIDVYSINKAVVEEAYKAGKEEGTLKYTKNGKEATAKFQVVTGGAVATIDSLVCTAMYEAAADAEVTATITSDKVLDVEFVKVATDIREFKKADKDTAAVEEIKVVNGDEEFTYEVDYASVKAAKNGGKVSYKVNGEAKEADVKVEADRVATVKIGDDLVVNAVLSEDGETVQVVTSIVLGSEVSFK